MIVNFLFRNRIPLLLAFFIYVLSFSIGMFLSYNSEIHQPIPESFYDMNPYRIKGNPDSPLFFLKYNLLVITILIVGGFSLGILTLLNLAFNGLIFGVVIGDFLNKISISKILILTLPHGIFELPATLLAGTVGFLIAKSFYNYLRFGEEPLKKQEQKDIFALSTFSIVLIVVAAIVEAKITTQFIGG
ncbi:MAG: stage II sporulation protein M [Methanosarcinales archaeon]